MGRGHHATAPCRQCGAARAPETPFKGALCRACYNFNRRVRYAHDPFHRQRRKEQRQNAYDSDKQAARMRAYRARLRARQQATQRPDSGEGA